MKGNDAPSPSRLVCRAPIRRSTGSLSGSPLVVGGSWPVRTRRVGQSDACTDPTKPPEESELVDLALLQAALAVGDIELAGLALQRLGPKTATNPQIRPTLDSFKLIIRRPPGGQADPPILRPRVGRRRTADGEPSLDGFPRSGDAFLLSGTRQVVRRPGSRRRSNRVIPRRSSMMLATCSWCAASQPSRRRCSG